MKKIKKSKNTYMQKKREWIAGTDENGSVMVIVLMVLVLVTLGGIAAINSSVTESYIVRNSAIHKQNLQLAEIAALEGFREILTRNAATELLPGGASAPSWILSDVPTFPLTSSNSAGPFSNPNFKINTIVHRGEADPLRYYFIGWRDAPQSSLVMTGSMWRQGSAIGIYNSDRYGLASVEIGVVKRF